jgi:hypothetical protein
MHWRTHLGSNPYFFRFVKHMKRNLLKVSYTKHFLSSSRSLKNKEILIYMDGGEIWKVGQDFETLWKLFLVTLEHGTCLHSTYNWVILLSLSHTNYMCRHTFSSSLRVLLFPSHYILGTRRVNAAKSVFMPHHVQGKFHFKPSICSISSFHFLCQSILIQFTILHHFPVSVSCCWRGIHQGPSWMTLFLSN